MVPDAWRFWQASSSGAYVPAQVQYVMLFSPVLTEHLGAEDPARLIGQLLTCTSRESAVSHVQTVRRIALANALIDFGTSMQHHCRPEASDEMRTLAIHSSHRRFYLVEVVPDMWLHACVTLAQKDGEALPYLVDAWMQRQMLDAWHGWRLQHGSPHELMRTHGREALEHRLESYFSKWAWLWDVDAQYAPMLRASKPSGMPPGLLTETTPTLPLVPDVVPDDLALPLSWFAEKGQSMDTPAPMDLLLLYDDKLLWPRTHPTGSALLSPQDRRHVARYVLERLVGLDAERAKAALVKPRQAPHDTALSDLPYVAAMLGEMPSSMEWPRPPSGQDVPPTAFQALHEQLEALDAPTPADQAARQLEDITRAYARTSTMRARRRVGTVPQHDPPPSSWYDAHDVPVVPHDFALDGWGPETPMLARHATLHVKAHDAEPLGASSSSSRPVDVMYMTRQLLTVVLVWDRGRLDADERRTWESPAWDLLRRVQRALHDVQRRTPSERVPFVCIDEAAAQCLNGLTPIPSGAEAQLLTAQSWMNGGASETLARADNHSFWVASRHAKDTSTRIFVALHGNEQRRYGVSECDQQMRRLAAQHREWGL